MIVRLGYVAICNTLNMTASKTITYSNFLKDPNGYERINDLITENLKNLKEILTFNVKNNIHFYRLTSHLIPLATLIKYDLSKYKDCFNDLSSIINSNDMRIDMHPDQFCVINLANKDAVLRSFDILSYHLDILKALDVKNPLLVLHVGSNVFGKEKSSSRFINNFLKLSDDIKSVIALENDDKIFSLSDTLNICEKLKVPCILDYHHFICNKNDDSLEKLLPRVFKTWNFTPKVHFSSPKNNTKKDMRSHHDYINGDSFISFLEIVKNYTNKLDVMIEAKMKDQALFYLVRYLKYKTNYEFLDDTTFIVN